MRGQVKIYQKKLSARRRRRVTLITLYSVAAAGLFFCLLSFISQLDFLSINKIEIEGNNRLASSTVSALVEKNMAGNYGAFFSKRNTFLYPKSDIRADLLALSLVKTAKILRPNFQTLIISLTERTKSAEWCSETSCYSIDAGGLIFAPEPRSGNSTSTVSSIIYRGLLNFDPIGKNLLPSNDFKKIVFFMNELALLADSSIEPREVELSSSGYITVILAGGGKLIINTADDLSTVLGNIFAIISNKAVAPSASAFLSKLDYMKLDIGNKVVYKLK